MTASPLDPRPDPPRPAWRRQGLLLLAVVVLELLATAVDIAMGPWSVVGFEEGRNARAGLMLACGHSDQLWSLQYRNFCGGCSAEAVLAAPLFRWFGPTVQVWKGVPALFHLVAVAAGAALTARAGRWWLGALWVGLMAAAPGFYRELVLTGWGNHAESGAFVLLGGCLLVMSVTAKVGWRGVLWALGGGGILGLGVWFAYISVYALPAAALLVVLGRRRGTWAALAGLAVGAVPWWAFHGARPSARAEAQAMWTGFAPASPDAALRWLVGDLLQPAVAWPGLSPGADVAGMVVVGLAMVAGVAGLVLAAIRSRHPTWLYAGVALLTLCGVYLLRHDLWADVPSLAGYDAFHLRYRAPLVPLIGLGLVGLVAGTAGRGRTLALGVVGLVIVHGLGRRSLAWASGPGLSAGAVVALPDGAPDPTVPEGEPPRRRPEAMGRAVDLAAGHAWIQGHADTETVCALHHEGELARRAGLGLRQAGRADVAAWAGQPREGVTLRVAAEGLATGLLRSGARSPAELDDRLARLENPALADAVRLAVGRRWGGERAAEAGGMWAVGGCEARGAALVEALTQGGRRLPEEAVAADALVDARGPCPEAGGWARGIGWAWGVAAGCGDLEAMRGILSVGDAALQEADLACRWRAGVR